jgi:hypothetical protein
VCEGKGGRRERERGGRRERVRGGKIRRLLLRQKKNIYFIFMM